MSALLLLATLPVRALWRRRPAAVGGRAPARAVAPGLRDSLRLVLGLAAPAGDRRDRGALLVRDRGRGLAVQGHGPAGARHARTPSPPSSAPSTRGSGVALRGDAGPPHRRHPAAASGSGPVLFLLPAGLLLGSAGLLVSGTLAAAVLLRAWTRCCATRSTGPAVELLYLPVPSELKLPAKSFIDTVAWRAGDGLAGLAVIAFATLGGLGPVRLALVTLPFIGLWLLLASRAHRRYVATLGEGLRQHRLDAERATTAVLDRETTELLAARLEAVDPREILYALDLMAVGRQAAATHPAVRGLLEPRGPRGAPPRARDPERGGRPVGRAAGGGAAARPPPRGAGRRRSSTSPATPTWTRSPGCGTSATTPTSRSARRWWRCSPASARTASRRRSRSSSRWWRRRARPGGGPASRRPGSRSGSPCPSRTRSAGSSRTRTRRWRGPRSGPPRGTGRGRSRPRSSRGSASRRSPSEAADALVAAGERGPRARLAGPRRPAARPPR